MYLFSKYGKNGSGSVTVLKPRGEWVYKKILLGTFSVGVQGIDEYYLKSGGRCGRRLSMRHECESREFEGDGGYLGDSCREEGPQFTERVRSEWSVRERVFLGIYQTDVDDRRSKDGR